MGTITLGKQWTDNEAVNYNDMNGNFTTIYSLVNGNIDNDNIKSSAGISTSKIAWSTGTWVRSILSLATADISAGTGKDEFTIPATVPSGKFVLESVELELDVAPGSSKTLTVDVNKNGTTILSSPITIEDTTSTLISTGNTPSVTSMSAGDRYTFDVDAATSGISTTRCRVNIIIKQYIQTT